MSGTAKGLNATASEWTPSSAGGSPTAPGAGIRGAGEYTSRRDGFGGGGGSYHPSYNGGGGNYGPGYSGGGGHAPMHHNNAAHGMHTPHHPHHHPAAHHSGPGGGFASHTAHSNFAPQHVAPGFGAPHHAPPPNQFPPNFGPRQPHAGQFAPHQPAWNNAVSMAPPPQTQRRPVILIMGAPKSGKKSLGEFLAPILGYAHIQPNPTMEWTERFDHVEREIAKNIDRCKGFIVSGYGAESDVDLYYLFHAVTKPRVAIHFVLYLDYTYIEMTKRLQSLDFTTTSPVMAAYATGYELCASHFSGLVEGFHNVQVMDGETPRSIKSIADECLPLIRKVIDNPQSAPVPAPKANAFDKWTLVTDHRLFRSLLTILDKALLTHTSDGVFPLRNPGGSIDYAKFARHYHQLQSYDVLLSTNGQRALIFKIGTNCIYALTEMCTCVYKLSDIPDTFSKHSGKGEDDLVFAVEADLCTIEHQGNTAAHVLLHDVLYYANRTMERVPWADRRDIILKQFGESSQQYVLPHVVHHIASISDLVAIITNIENIVVGFRFEHPYGYKASTALTDIDSRLLTWSDGEKPLVTLRVWSSTEGTRKVGNATEAYYRFEVLVVDDENGVEKPLQDVMLPAHAKVTGAPPVRNAVLEVPDHIVNSQQLNDGHIVECRYIRNPPPVIGKGPAARASQKTEWYAEGSWTFVRRRNDVLYPHYASTVNEAIKKPGWKRDELIAACSEIPARPPRPEA